MRKVLEKLGLGGSSGDCSIYFLDADNFHSAENKGAQLVLLSFLVLFLSVNWLIELRSARLNFTFLSAN
jgi:hypothetical protein